MKHFNPFIAGPTLQNPEKFVGREEELRGIIGRMGGSQPTSLNIVGEHQIGKSSLLYYFFLTWEQLVSQPQNYVVIYLSLKNANCQKEENFYQAVAKKLFSCPSVRFQPRLVELLQVTPLNRLGFSQAIEEFKKQGLLPVLCLDDFESLFANRDERKKEFDDGFYDNLRSLMDDSALMLILASCKALEVYGQEHRFVSSFFNVGHVIKLRELNTDQAIKLTRLPINSLEETPALTENEQNLAQQWGKRHPYLLQLAGYYLWEARQNGKNFKWAKKQFEHQVSKYKSKLKGNALYWLTPRWVWKTLQFIGGFVNFVENSTKSIIGLLIIIALILAVFGVVELHHLIAILEFLGIKI
ncbi:MAG: ATP-binding protein [Cyanobacteria bacterium J06573_2]